MNKVSDSEEVQMNDMKVNVPLKQDKRLLTLRWKNLKMVVETPEGPKEILHGVNGSVNSQQVVAILGPSGSGKTSLLNCISLRIRSGVEGEILLNGTPVPNNFRSFTGYVSQDDIFMETLSVWETLMFSARLKLRASTAVINEKVQKVIQALDLDQVQDSRIGVIGEGISGGERRRLAIGVEIIDNPSILLLDEPTSGLDSASALMVVNLLKKLAQEQHMAVVATIHQPRAVVARSFDKLSLMANGECLYFGKTIPHCLEFFNSCGYECPTFENPADWLLDLVNTDTEAHTREEVTKNILESFRRIEANNVQSDHSGSFAGGLDESGYRTSVFNQIYVLTWRIFLNQIRDPISFATQAFNSTVVIGIIGLIYLNLGLSQTSINDRIRALSLVVMMQSFMCFDVILQFPKERKLYLREQTAAMYRTSTYFISRSAADFPMHLTLTFLAGTIFYWMAGFQNDATKFLNFLALIEGATICGASMMVGCGALAANMEQANLVATLFIIIFLILDGSWVDLNRIPLAIRWIKDVSFMGLAVRGAVYNELSGLKFDDCPVPDDPDAVCFKTGEEALEFNNMDNEDVGYNVAMIIVINFLWRFMTYFAIRFLHTGRTCHERLNT